MTPDALLVAVFAWVGLAVGSFFNVVIHRLPRGGSIAYPASKCPHCEHPLRWYDNIPVLGYLWLGGRCRHCRTPISIRYPIVEILTMVLFLVHLYVFGWTVLMGIRLAFACALLVLFAIDLEHQLLPNVITLPGIAAGLIVSVIAPPGLLDAVLGAILGGGVLWLIGAAYWRATGQEGMGGGDVKMLAMIGAFLGWQLVLVTLVLSSVAGSVVGLLLIVTRRGSMKYALPYGTFLAIGALVASLAGARIVAWYVGLYSLP